VIVLDGGPHRVGNGGFIVEIIVATIALVMMGRTIP
jgi:hypothetical protein